MKLFIANKNYSSWSMRSWIILKAFDIPFEEVIVAYPSEQRKTGRLFQHINPTGKVPALLDQPFNLGYICDC